MAFIDKDLEKLSQNIINRAVQKQSPTGSPNLLVDRLRQSILRRRSTTAEQQTKLPRI